MPVPSVFPSSLPITAPANNVVPFTRPPSPPSGAVVQPPVIQPPIAPSNPSAPAPPVPSPGGTPSGFGGGVSTFPGVPAAGGAVGGGAAGFAGGAAAVAGGVAGFLAFDLFFPPPAAAPEAPRIPVPHNPIDPAPTRPAPITQPPEGIIANAVYRLEATVKITALYGERLSTTEERAGEYFGSELPDAIRLYYSSYDVRDRFEEKKIQSLRIVYLRGGTVAPTKPDFIPLQKPLTPTVPLQDPLPKDDKGKPVPILFVPPPAPVIIPFTRPPQTAPAPTPEPLPPVPDRKPVPIPPVIPEEKPSFPPIGVPDYKPGYPVYPGGDPIPLKRPGNNPNLPGLPQSAPQPAEKNKVPPGVFIPNFKPNTPTDEDAKFDPTQQLIPPPPRPPIQIRQQGADCCACPPCPEPEPIEPPNEMMQSVLLGVGNSGSYSLPNRTQRVSLSVTSMSPAVRSQSGGANGKDIYFVGSYAFGWDGAYSDRNPVSYVENVFSCPPTASNFNFQLNYGSQASVVAYYIVVIP